MFLLIISNFFFCIFLLCILATSNLSCLCLVFTIFVFIVPILELNVFLVSLILLRRSSYLSLLFPGTLHSVGCIFPFLSCPLLLFFPQLFVKPPQTTGLPSCVSFFGDGLGTASCSMLQTSGHSSSGTLSTRSDPLNLFITSTI